MHEKSKRLKRDRRLSMGSLEEVGAVNSENLSAVRSTHKNKIQCGPRSTAHTGRVTNKQGQVAQEVYVSEMFRS